MPFLKGSSLNISFSKRSGFKVGIKIELSSFGSSSLYFKQIFISSIKLLVSLFLRDFLEFIFFGNEKNLFLFFGDLFFGDLLFLGEKFLGELSYLLDLVTIEFLYILSFLKFWLLELVFF
jgi:hypothetical protein